MTYLGHSRQYTLLNKQLTFKVLVKYHIANAVNLSIYNSFDWYIFNYEISIISPLRKAD